MITALLLLPVLLILIWLYAYLLPDRRWRWIDSVVVVMIVGLTALYIVLTAQRDLSSGGPLWPEIVSVVGAYAIVTLGLGAALWWRRLGK